MDHNMDVWRVLRAHSLHNVLGRGLRLVVVVQRQGATMLPLAVGRGFH